MTDAKTNTVANNNNNTNSFGAVGVASPAKFSKAACATGSRIVEAMQAVGVDALGWASTPGRGGDAPIVTNEQFVTITNWLTANPPLSTKRVQARDLLRVATGLAAAVGPKTKENMSAVNIVMRRDLSLRLKELAPSIIGSKSRSALLIYLATLGLESLKDRQE